MISRSTDIKGALRSKQRGLLLNPFRFGTTGGDPYRGNVVFLFHMDGANGSTTFTDNSPSPKVLTPNVGLVISTATSVFGGASGRWNGSAYGTFSAALPAATADFTFEGRFRFDDTGTDRAFMGANGNGNLDFACVGNTIRVGRINTAWDSQVNWTRTINTWYHIAICRSGTDIRFFVDGTQVGTTITNSISYNAPTGGNLGASTPTTRRLAGYMDEVCYTVGSARYTANFTPPAAPYPNF